MQTSPRQKPEDSGEPELADDPVFERDPALHPLASQIRFGFIFAHRRHHRARTGRPGRFGESLDPRWDGVEGQGGRRRRAIWHDVARLVLIERIDPIDLIEAAFSVADEGCLPEPISLLSPAVAARARDDRGLAVENLRVALRAQENIWKMQAYLIKHREGCDLNTAASQALKDRSLDLYTLFRYCTATECGDVEVAGLFEEAAFEHYLLNKWAFDRAWGELIPAALKGRADRFRRGG